MVVAIPLILMAPVVTAIHANLVTMVEARPKKVIDVNFLTICLILFQGNLAATGNKANVFAEKIAHFFTRGSLVVALILTEV